MIATAGPIGYRRALDAILHDPAVDSALAIFVPPLGVRQEDIAHTIGEVAKAHPGKPVLAVLMGVEGLPHGRAELRRAGVPAYIFPESAARALAALCRQSEWTRRPTATVPNFAVDRERAHNLLADSAATGGRKLSEIDALALLQSYGITTVPGRLAHTAEEAVAIAGEIGLPVAMKISAQGVLHKSDAGGVRLKVDTFAEVERAFREIVENVARAVPEVEPTGVVVQKMMKGGCEMIAGVVRDRSFGPMILFGLGGVFVEAIHDTSLRMAPLSENDAREMIEEIRGRKVLDGYRGLPPVDRTLLVDQLLRLSQLALDHEEIAELDINPLVATPEGLVALDARVLLAAPE